MLHVCLGVIFSFLYCHADTFADFIATVLHQLLENSKTEWSENNKEVKSEINHRMFSHTPTAQKTWEAWVCTPVHIHGFNSNRQPVKLNQKQRITEACKKTKKHLYYFSWCFLCSFYKWVMLHCMSRALGGAKHFTTSISDGVRDTEWMNLCTVLLCMSK